MRKITWVPLIVALLGGLLAAPGHATALGSEGMVAFVRANQVHTMTKAGGTVRQLTTTGKNYQPEWSPDGRRIAYIDEDAAGHTNVAVMSATGRNKTTVTTSGTVTTAPTWSPDGRTLAFGQTGTYRFTPFCYPELCPERPPYDVQGNYVFLVKATAPFGAPTMLNVYRSPGSRLFDAEPIRVYAGSSMVLSPNSEDLALVNSDSGDSPDTGLHVVHGMRGATAATAPGTVHEEDIIDSTGGECCGFQEWSDLNYIPNGRSATRSWTRAPSRAARDRG